MCRTTQLSSKAKAANKQHQRSNVKVSATDKKRKRRLRHKNRTNAAQSDALSALASHTQATTASGTPTVAPAVTLKVTPTVTPVATGLKRKHEPDEHEIAPNKRTTADVLAYRARTTCIYTVETKFVKRWLKAVCDKSDEPIVKDRVPPKNKCKWLSKSEKRALKLKIKEEKENRESLRPYEKIAKAIGRGWTSVSAVRLADYPAVLDACLRAIELRTRVVESYGDEADHGHAYMITCLSKWYEALKRAPPRVHARRQ